MTIAGLGRFGGASVWSLHLDLDLDDAARAWDLLSLAERQRAAAFLRDGVRRRWVAARAGLRLVLAGGNRARARTLELVGGRWDKPRLEGGPRFSISHAGGLALCAVAGPRLEVGVDLEDLREIDDVDALARRSLGPELAAYLADHGAPAHERFLRAWTRREAHLKALGTGLAGEVEAGALDPGRWEVHELRPAPGYVAAVVIERPPVCGVAQPVMR